jgi:hypothetical protein
MPFPSPQECWPPWARDAVQPVTSLSLWRYRPMPSPGWHRKATLYIFLCHFGPTNPDCHIALICYIATSLRYAALLWYATLPHCFDMLCCHWYVAFLWCATLPHCFDMLHIATLLLFCFILIYLNAYYIAQWWKSARWDECANMDQHHCTIKISASNNMKQIGYPIKLSLSQSRWSFLLLFAIVLRVRPFLMTEATTQHFISPWSAFSTESRTTN